MSVSGESDFVRHVGGSHIHGTEINGSAFERAPKDTDGVSISIRRIFSPDTQTDVAEIRRVVGARRKLGKNSVFAELNVGTALSVLREFDETIEIISNPLPATDEFPSDPSHGLITGLPIKDDAIGSLRSELAGDLLARRILRIYPAVI